MNISGKPIILLPACNQQLGPYPSHTIGAKYVEAARLAGGLPLVVPQAQAQDFDQLLAHADGLLLTGSPSNVHPGHFGEDVHDIELPLDPVRDDWTLPIVTRVLAIGMPLLAICRGAQEVNVALGGTLYQAVHAAGPYADHRSRDEDAVDVQYGPVHEVLTEPGGLLRAIVGAERFRVNSLHGQAVRRLADGLRVEARAPDGLIEAFSAPGATGFNLAVQWHPEWQAALNPVSMRILEAFGLACQNYRERPRTPLPSSR
jgi:putative glutamine amidotransferase